MRVRACVCLLLMNFDSWICVHLRLCACVLIIFVMVLMCFFVSVSPKCLKIRTQFAIYITHICHVEKLCIELVLFFCSPPPLLFIVFFFYIVWFIFPCIRQMAKTTNGNQKLVCHQKPNFCCCWCVYVVHTRTAPKKVGKFRFCTHWTSANYNVIRIQLNGNQIVHILIFA